MAPRASVRRGRGNALRCDASGVVVDEDDGRGNMVPRRLRALFILGLALVALAVRLERGHAIDRAR